MKNSYVMLNKHHYSVPKEYIGKRVDIVYDADSLQIYHGLKLVTSHMRNDTPYGYTQKEAHRLPGRHGSYEKDLGEIYERAGAIDNILLNYLREVAAQKKYLPLAFRTCRGIMSLEKKYGLARLVAACACASEGRQYGFISWLVAREWDYRSSAAIDRLIRGASFRYNAYPEEIDYSISRGLNQNQMERLLSLDFVRQGQNLFITGSAGTGKSFLATAIGYHACKNGIRTLYSNTSKLLSSLKVAKAKNTIETELKKIERCQLLILDDAFLVPLDAKERPILLEIIEDRHDRKSIVMASQLPVENWYDAIGDQAVADAVLDRIVHSSHRIELFGESIRKMKTKK